MSRFIWALVGLALVAGVTSARAETPADVAEKWGLSGEWRIDCALPPSAANFNEGFRVREGKLYLERINGQGSASDLVVAAHIRPDHSIAIFIRFDFAGQTRENDVVKVGGRKRVMSNRRADGSDYSVRDGVAVGSGQATPWMNHCD